MTDNIYGARCWFIDKKIIRRNFDKNSLQTDDIADEDDVTEIYNL